MNKLKPCPFCGGKQQFISFDDYNVPIIYCRCEAIKRGEGHVTLKDLPVPEITDDEIAQPWLSAVEAWNRRAEPEGEL